MMKIGENICTLRKAKNLTQQQIADSLGVSVAAVSKWESASAYPDIELLPKIANLFDVSVDYLLGYEMKETDITIDEHIDHALKLVYEKKSREAVEYMASVAVRYPNNIKIKLAHAKVKFYATHGMNKTQRHKDLLKDAEQILKSINETELSRSEYEELYSNLSQIYRIGEQFEKSAGALKKIERNRKVHPEQLQYLLYIKQGQNEKALRYMQTLLLWQINDLIATLEWITGNYSQSYEKIGIYQFIINLLDVITEGIPSAFDFEYIYSYEAIAHIYAILGDKEKSIENFISGIKYGRRFDLSELKTYKTIPMFENADESDIYLPSIGATSIDSILYNPEREEYALIRDDERILALCDK